MILEFPVRLPRHAFSPRNAARAGDVWRALQEVATDGSTARGWPPARYRDEGIGFIVREMIVVHSRETAHGEPLVGRTWVKDFKRGLVTTREIRIEGDAGRLCSASQEWVHVRSVLDAPPGEPPVRPMRASPDLIASFAFADPEPSPVLPGFQPIEGTRTHTHGFSAWHTWMDPLGHANHPQYVDWCDEATCAAMHAVGLDPQALEPIAEVVRFKSGVRAPGPIMVETRLVGVTEAGDAVLQHEIKSDRIVAASATTVRRLFGAGGDALIAGLS